MIDTDDNIEANNPESITLTDSETIRITDSNADGDADADTATVANNFVIETGDTGTVIFAEDTAGDDGAAAVLTITGDLEGVAEARGDTLNASVRAGVNEDESTFNVLGSTNMTAVTITAGAGGDAADGGNFAANFGDGQTDVFDVTTFTATGGAGSNADFNGGDTTTTITANTTIANLDVTGGTGDASDVAVNGGDGGSSTLTITDENGATFTAAIDVTGGAGGVDGTADAGVGGVGGDATFFLNGGDSTGTDLNIIGGAGGVANDAGNGGVASVTINGGLALTGDLEVSDGADNDATGGNATLTVGGTLSVAEDIAVTSSEITVEDGGTLSLAGNISTTGASAVTINEGGTFEFNAASGSQASHNNLTYDGPGTLAFSGGDGTVTFYLGRIGGTTELGAMTFSDGRDATFDINVSAHDVTVGDGSVATLNGTSAVTGDITGEGTLILGNTFLTLGEAGQSSTVSVANFDSIADNFGRIGVADGAMVTIDTSIGANSAIETFSAGRADDTLLTINSGTRNGGETAITGSTVGDLTMGAGTIVLGSNIGDGDTVFSFTGDTFLVTTANETTTVQLSANFLETDDVITLAETGTDQANALDDNDFVTEGQLVVTQTALTEYTLGVEDGAATGSDIIVTATARSASETADELGVSEEDAVAMRRAVESTDAAGDLEGLDELTTVLNADDDGASAAQAARQVGTQEDTLGGASEASFQTSGEMFDAITDRLQGSPSGFSGGDLDGPYSLQTTSARGV